MKVTDKIDSGATKIELERLFLSLSIRIGQKMMS